MLFMAVNKSKCAFCQFVCGIYLCRCVTKQFANTFGSMDKTKCIKICSFVGKRRCNGYFAAAEQIRKAFAEVVGAGISSLKIVGEGETVAGFGGD